MTQDLLHATQVGTAFEQMRRGRVPQPVWPGIGDRLGSGYPGVHDPPDGPRVYPAALRAQEQGRTGSRAIPIGAGAVGSSLPRTRRNSPGPS